MKVLLSLLLLLSTSGLLTFKQGEPKQLSNERLRQSNYFTLKEDLDKLRIKVKNSKTCRKDKFKKRKARKRCIQRKIKRLDPDKDGIVKKIDNCPSVRNNDQADIDLDGIGNLCDNCPQISNPTQTDSNGDGLGDACSESKSELMTFFSGAQNGVDFNLIRNETSRFTLISGNISAVFDGRVLHTGEGENYVPPSSNAWGAEAEETATITISPDIGLVTMMVRGTSDTSLKGPANVTVQFFDDQNLMFRQESIGNNNFTELVVQGLISRIEIRNDSTSGLALIGSLTFNE